MMMYGETFYGLHTTVEKNKSQKRLPLETKNIQNHENRRLGLIEIQIDLKNLCMSFTGVEVLGYNQILSVEVMFKRNS